MTEKIKKTFVIETSPEVMDRFERFLAMLHYNSSFGHSGTFAMPLDGDGSDKVKISPKPRFQHEVDILGGVGGDIEIALNGCFTAKNMKPLGRSYIVKTTGTLYINGDQEKTVPFRLR